MYIRPLNTSTITITPVSDGAIVVVELDLNSMVALRDEIGATVERMRTDAVRMASEADPNGAGAGLPLQYNDRREALKRFRDSLTFAIDSARQMQRMRLIADAEELGRSAYLANADVWDAPREYTREQLAGWVRGWLEAHETTTAASRAKEA